MGSSASSLAFHFAMDVDYEDDAPEERLQTRVRVSDRRADLVGAA